MIDERAESLSIGDHDFQTYPQPYLRRSYFVVCFLLPLSLAASTNAGRVSGKILDPRGVPVAGAHLQLLNSAAAVIREAKSDEQGGFILGDIDQGEYQWTAEEPTFVSVILDFPFRRDNKAKISVLWAGYGKKSAK